jgi:hypothetical protein
MQARTPGTHWLRENHLERSPKRLLIVDTETRPISADNVGRQVLRLWCARLVRRHDVDPKKPRSEDFDGYTAAELVELIEGQARADASLWLMTHNLNFDLAVTELPVRLVEAGWRMTEGALTTADPWCRFAKGRRRLTITDSWSYLPTGVEALGVALGYPKLPLPDWLAPDEAWRARCRRDVEIVDRSIGQLMDWWDAGRFGNWSLTGPSTGWSSYRHHKPRPRVMVEPDPQARALEQRAITGGRRGVSQVGLLPLGLYADVDITTAHLAVMGNFLLPARRLKHFDRLEFSHTALRSQVIDVVAECEVETAAPRYPWQSGRGIFYPVGRFRCVLAGPEIRAAMERGELRAIGPGYTYLLGNHMQGWAHWLAGLLDESSTDAPATAKLAAKHWSRCVPGKWAGHTSEVVAKIADPRPGWLIERGWLVKEARPADFLLIGHELWTIRRDDWADDAFPAILAFIQAHTRVALSRLLDLAGPAAMVSNTDGALLDLSRLPLVLDSTDSGPADLERRKLVALNNLCTTWSAMLAPFNVRPKGAARSVTVLSPQHLLLDQERRLAGVPASAQALGDHRYSFTAWPKLRLQLIRANGPGYETDARQSDLSNIQPAGWLTESGAVIPPTVSLDVDGVTRLGLPTWDQSTTGDRLAAAERQHPILRRRLAEYDNSAVTAEVTR